MKRATVVLLALLVTLLAGCKPEKEEVVIAGEITRKGVLETCDTLSVSPPVVDCKRRLIVFVKRDDTGEVTKVKITSKQRYDTLKVGDHFAEQASKSR